MLLAAINYYRYNMLIPEVDFSNSKINNVYNTAILNYILHSQFAVFESGNILKQKALSYTSSAEVHCLSSVKEEFPFIKKALDNGSFVLLGLRPLQNFNKALHQVLAYGYDDANHTLYVYDSDNPNEEVIIKDNGHRLLFSNGKQYLSYYLLMSLIPGFCSGQKIYDSTKNLLNNYSIKPPQA